MVHLTITPAILDALEECRSLHLDFKDFSIDEKNTASCLTLGDPILHSQVITLSKLLTSYNNTSEASTSYHLDQLLKGSKLYKKPPKQKPKPTSDYIALMTRLRREEEFQVYERMTNPPLSTATFAERFPGSANTKLFPTLPRSDFDEDDEITYADINRQMTLIINILVSILACGVAIWMASSYWSTPKRLGLSMGGSGLVGIGEVVVYAGYLRRLREARKNGKKQIEVKEVVKTWVIGGGDSKESQENFKIIESEAPVDSNIRRRVHRAWISTSIVW